MKTLVTALLPPPLRRGLRRLLDQRRHRRCQRDWLRQRSIANAVFLCTGGVVASGPFRGLRYPDTATGRLLAPKLAGTYAKEITPIVEDCIARGYRTVIHLSDDDGYFAVGVALRLPQARVFVHVLAYADPATADPDAPRRLAAHNGVADRLQVLYAASELRAVATHGNHDLLIICDSIGLQCKEAAAALLATVPHADALLAIRPGDPTPPAPATHEALRIHPRPRTADDFPPTVRAPADVHLRGVTEPPAGPPDWLWMRHKVVGSAGPAVV